MKDFKVGDTVICNISFQNYPQKGWKGKVISIGTDPTYIIGVEWEKEFKWGHSCDGVGNFKYCRYYEDLLDTSSFNVIKKLEEKQLELF